MNFTKKGLWFTVLCLAALLAACGGEGEGNSKEKTAVQGKSKSETYQNNYDYFVKNPPKYEILSNSEKDGVRELYITTDAFMSNHFYGVEKELYATAKDDDALIIKVISPEDKANFENAEPISEVQRAITDRGHEILGIKKPSIGYGGFGLTLFYEESIPENLYQRINNEKFKDGVYKSDVPEGAGKGELTITSTTDKTFDYSFFVENHAQHLGIIEGTAFIQDNAGFSEIDEPDATSTCQLVFIIEDGSIGVTQNSGCADEYYAAINVYYQGSYKYDGTEQIQEETENEELTNEEQDINELMMGDEIYVEEGEFFDGKLGISIGSGAGIAYGIVNETPGMVYDSFSVHIGIPKGGKAIDNVSNKQFKLVDIENNGKEYPALDEAEIKRVTGNDRAWTDEGERIEEDGLAGRNIAFDVPAGVGGEETRWLLKITGLKKGKTFIFPVEVYTPNEARYN